MFLFKIEILLNWNFILKEERMNLPVEFIVKILVEYHGGYSYRNGKFMTRILAEDERRKLIERVVPHPNKHLSKWGDICINLRISETKHYKLQLYYIDIDWREEPEPRISISLWSNILW